jgi:cytochrome c-type biogenesis protein CcmE
MISFEPDWHRSCHETFRQRSSWEISVTHVRLKLTAAGVAIAIAVTFLAVAGIREGWVYYLPVDEFVAGDTYHDQRVRLHGTVAADNLDVASAMLTAGFDLLGEQRRLRVQYEGVIPDMFQADREVVVEGRLDETGVFRADTLLTKCASKYEPGDGEAPHADPQAAGNSG